MQTHTIVKPMHSDELKEKINAVIEQPTGDPEADAAFAKMQKV